MYESLSFENTHNEGKLSPLQIFKLGEGNKILMFEDGLEKMLKSEVTKNREVCVISVAGIFREGKSFLMNFLLHFLKKKPSNGENWMDTKETLVPGFRWKTTAKRITEGIQMWPEIFIVKTAPNTETAIILIDTQGTSDHTISDTECASLFALSVLISSVQIYNIKNKLTAENLKMLQLFTSYGSTVCDSSDEKPFQKLVILVRDWENKHDYPFGFEGGKKMLDNVFQQHTQSQKQELLTIQETINKNFDEVDCFLMPHPGKYVATSQNFDGKFEDIDEDFREYMKRFVESVIAPENLVPKKIDGRCISVESLLGLIKTSGNHFKSGKQLNVKTIFEATAEEYHMQCITKAVLEYSECIKQCHNLIQAMQDGDKIFQIFAKKMTKMGAEELIEKYKFVLREKCDDVFNKHKTRIRRTEIKKELIYGFSTCAVLSTVLGSAAQVEAVVASAEIITTTSVILEAAVTGGFQGFLFIATIGGPICLLMLGMTAFGFWTTNSETEKEGNRTSPNAILLSLKQSEEACEIESLEVNSCGGDICEKTSETCTQGDGLSLKEAKDEWEAKNDDVCSDDKEIFEDAVETCTEGSVNGLKAEVGANGDDAKYTGNLKENNLKSWKNIRGLIKPVVVAVAIVVLACCFTFFTH